VLAKRLAQQEVAQCNPADLVGAILLAPVRLTTATIRKGTRVDHSLAASLVAAARADHLSQALRIAWPDPSDLHEDTAAEQLAAVAAGPGVERRQPRQSRLDLVAKWNGVLHVETDRLIRFNTVDSIELFTLFHGQAVQAGQVIASVKVAPHLISAALVQAGIQVARESGPLVEVRPYVPVEVAAIVTETVSGVDLERFQSGARMKVEALGSRFVGTTLITSAEIEAAEREIRMALDSLVVARRIPLVLVGGVSAGDPLAPFYSALDGMGGRVLRHGVPAHPGSMIWLAELGESRLLGLPQCGMFTLATAADLILPRLLTGEWLTARELAELAHGGVLTREMRFRFPQYAQNLEAPEG
jgi:hypothetical protein